MCIGLLAILHLFILVWEDFVLSIRGMKRSKQPMIFSTMDMELFPGFWISVWELVGSNEALKKDEKEKLWRLDAFDWWETSLNVLPIEGLINIYGTWYAWWSALFAAFDIFRCFVCSSWGGMAHPDGVYCIGWDMLIVSWIIVNILRCAAYMWHGLNIIFWACIKLTMWCLMADWLCMFYNL